MPSKTILKNRVTERGLQKEECNFVVVSLSADGERVCKLLESGSDKELGSPNLQKVLWTPWYQSTRTVSKALTYKNSQVTNWFISLSLW